MVAEFSAETDFVLGARRRLFSDGVNYSLVLSGRRYDVSPEGDRFLVLSGDGAAAASEDESPAELIVVEHWFEELKERVPVPWYAGINRYVVANERVVQERK